MRGMRQREAAGDQCKAYGAPGLMRLPTRLHITWQDDTTLKVETDTGTQTRLLHFGDWKPPAGGPTRQGNTTAQWEMRQGRRGQPPPPPDQRFGNLKTMTTGVDAGVPAQERRAVQREDHADGALGSASPADWRTVDCDHDSASRTRRI